MAIKKSKVDINTASAEELTTISGIGPELAERIIAARPFGSVENLVNVPGIGAVLLKRIKPELKVEEESLYDLGGESLVVGTVDEEDIYEEVDPFELEKELAEKGEVEDAQAVPVDEKIDVSTRQAVPIGKPVSRDEEVRPHKVQNDERALLRVLEPARTMGDKLRSDVKKQDSLIMAISIGIAVLLLSLILSLGILAAINRGLAYVPARDFSTLQTQTDSLAREAEALRQDVDAIQKRLDTLGTLSGRVTDLENEVTALKQELESTVGRMDDLESKLEGFSEEIERIDQRTGVFQEFLGELRLLLVRLVPVDVIK